MHRAWLKTLEATRLNSSSRYARRDALGQPACFWESRGLAEQIDMGFTLANLKFVDAQPTLRRAAERLSALRSMTFSEKSLRLT